LIGLAKNNTKHIIHAYIYIYIYIILYYIIYAHAHVPNSYTHTHMQHTLTHAYIYIVVISYKGEAITVCTCLANGRVLSSKKNFSFYSRPPRGPVVLSSLLQQFFSSISAVCSISFHFGLSYLYSLFFPGKKKEKKFDPPGKSRLI